MTEEKPKKLTLTPELLREIEIFSGHFLMIDEIAYNLGVKPEYFQRFCEKHAEVIDAVSRGRAKTKGFVVGQLMKKIKEGNVTAITFFLRTQGGWAENHLIGLTKAPRAKIVSKKLGTDPNEAIRIYQEIMK